MVSLEYDGRPLLGEFYRLGKVVNTMVEELNSFTSEVTRVAHEVPYYAFVLCLLISLPSIRSVLKENSEVRL